MSTPKRKGRPPHDVPPPPPMAWESKAVAKQIQNILNALEMPTIDPQARLTLQRLLYRRDTSFGGGGAGMVILTLRCITESNGNENALIEPIVGAVWGCLEPKFIDCGVALIEAFDSVSLIGLLQTMRGLDLFKESSLGHYYSIALRNKISAILDPLVPKPAPPVKVKGKRPTKPAKRRPAAQPARRMAA
jgi:hypothetical protein